MAAQLKQIRAASVEDSAVLAQVQVDSFRDSYAGILPQSYLAGFSYEEQALDWRELISGESPDVLFVAEMDDGDIGGYALARKLQGDTSESELISLHIRRKYQRQGIGGELVKTVARHLKEQGAVSLMLWVLAQNHLARKFYEHLGGKLAEQRTIPVSDDATAGEVSYRWVRIEDLME